MVIKGTPDTREEQPEHLEHLEQLHNSKRSRNFSDKLEILKDSHVQTDVEDELL